eukprot:3406462-Rhodomonas_salina.1
MSSADICDTTSRQIATAAADVGGKRMHVNAIRTWCYQGWDGADCNNCYLAHCPTTTTTVKVGARVRTPGR